MNANDTAADVTVDGVTMDAKSAACLIELSIHRVCFVGVCPVFPTVVREGPLLLVRWMDAVGSVRSMARI